MHESNSPAVAWRISLILAKRSAVRRPSSSPPPSSSCLSTLVSSSNASLRLHSALAAHPIWTPRRNYNIIMSYDLWRLGVRVKSWEGRLIVGYQRRQASRLLALATEPTARSFQRCEGEGAYMADLTLLGPRYSVTIATRMVSFPSKAASDRGASPMVHTLPKASGYQERLRRHSIGSITLSSLMPAC